MAKDASFDIVSELDMQEVDNAVNQADKEIVNRYDLKSSNTSMELSKGEGVIDIESASDFTLKAAVDILQTKFVKRDISLKALDYGKVEQASGARVRQRITLKQGITQEHAKQIIKCIKESGIKVQVANEGDKVRVSGKSRDLLQEVIQLMKSSDIDTPLQFNNYR